MKLKFKKEWFDNNKDAFLAAGEADAKLKGNLDPKATKDPAFLMDGVELDASYEVLGKNSLGVLIENDEVEARVVLEIDDVDLMNLFVQNDEIYLLIKQHLRQVLKREKVYK